MMRSNWFQILVALAPGELHGSAIAKDVLERTDGELRLWPATLYRTLDELSDAGLSEQLIGENHPDGESRRKRYYRITQAGRVALAEETARLEALARSARQRLGGTA